MFTILIFYIIVLYILLSWIRLLRDARRINVKGPLPLPLLGNAHLFIVKSSEFLNLLYKLSVKYGDAFRVHFLSTPHVILSHPKYIEPLLASSELITKGPSYRYLLPWLGQGLLTSTGHRWKTHRKFLTPAFHFSILQNFLPVFCKNQNILTEKLRGLANGTYFDLFPIVALAALDNVTESVMGLSMNMQNNMNGKSEYLKSIEVLTTILAMRVQIPLLGIDSIFNWSPYKTKHDKALKYLHEYSKSVIEARFEQLKKENITSIVQTSDNGIRNKHAFLDLLLLGSVDGKNMDIESVREHVETFMFAGHDTTTSGIVYSLYCLAKYRDVQEKIFQEQKQIFGDDIHKDPTYSELQQMKYLELVIRESMRLYSPVPAIERIITSDCEVGELKLIKGTSVMINIFNCQRHPDLFEDPLEFRPERFKLPLKHPFSWLAFSAGPRNCIGQRFAMMELKVTISAIIKNFILIPAENMEPECTHELILRSTNGVHIGLLPRK